MGLIHFKEPACCFTGRRPKDLFGYDRNQYFPLVNALKDNVRSLYHTGYRVFISGGAQGVDQLAFWAVNALKRDEHLPILNVCYLPFPGQEHRWAKTGLFSQTDYKNMLEYADQYLFVTSSVNMDDKGAVVKALHTRNHAMVDDTDYCIGVYPNQDWRVSKGGTAECLKYVESQHKSAYILSPITLSVVDRIF